jgi:uncharacterized surface protein with fasciclin (FAS1) repeats
MNRCGSFANILQSEIATEPETAVRRTWILSVSTGGESKSLTNMCSNTRRNTISHAFRQWTSISILIESVSGTVFATSQDTFSNLNHGYRSALAKRIGDHLLQGMAFWSRS